MTTIQIFRRNNRRYYYRILTSSGHSILSSDGYESRPSCLKIIERVKNQIAKEENIVLEKFANGTCQFKLKDEQGEIIGYSMAFHSEKQLRKWLNLLQDYLPESALEDVPY